MKIRQVGGLVFRYMPSITKLPYGVRTLTDFTSYHDFPATCRSSYLVREMKDVDLQNAVDVILSPFPYSESTSDKEYFEMRDKALGYVRAMAEEMDLVHYSELDREAIERIIEVHIKKVKEWIPVADEAHKELIHEMCRFFDLPELDSHGNPIT